MVYELKFVVHLVLKGDFGTLPRGSKYLTLEVSESKDHSLWYLGPETLNNGYLDPLGLNEE